MSGLPCVDNSKAKQGREFEEGPTGPLFAVWALRMKRYRVKLGVLENTPDARLHLRRRSNGTMRPARYFIFIFLICYI